MPTDLSHSEPSEPQTSCSERAPEPAHSEPAEPQHPRSDPQTANSSPSAQAAPELSPKAAARRAAILSAARTVFVRDGYHDTKLTVVAKEAGCSVGTLYTYFDNREALLSAVLDVVENEMREASGDKGEVLSPAQRVSATNRAYLASFRANAKEMALMEQVAQFDATVNEHRTTRAQRFLDRNARLIAKVSSAPDPEMTATALSVMVSRLAFNTWVDGLFPDTDETFERIAATVDEVWFRTLGLENPRG